MSASIRAALIKSLSPHLGLSKSRLETLAVFLLALINGRTVNMAHIASQFHGAALCASSYRRLQRFFQYVRLDQRVIALLIVRMLNLSRPKCLALDRTNWKVGSKNINILMLAVVTRRFRVPLLWSTLSHQGNSDSAQRIALLERYLALFGVSSIERVLADREFIGAPWIMFLIQNNIPFAIRCREGMHFSIAGGAEWSLTSLLRRKRARRAVVTFSAFMPGTEIPIQFAARRIKGGEWLIVMTNSPHPALALAAYKKRWAIECLFADTKTRGFNFEDTRLVNLEKIETLTALIAMAVAWVYRTSSAVMGNKPIKRKTHGRPEKSWFRIGFDALRNHILHAHQKAIDAWIDKGTKRIMGS